MTDTLWKFFFLLFSLLICMDISGFGDVYSESLQVCAIPLKSRSDLSKEPLENSA